MLRSRETLDGYPGNFIGFMNKRTGLPDGYGIFRIGEYGSEWVHCGLVRNGTFAAGRAVSVNRAYKVLVLENKKHLVNGSVIEKIERYSK